MPHGSRSPEPDGPYGWPSNEPKAKPKGVLLSFETPPYEGLAPRDARDVEIASSGCYGYLHENRDTCRYETSTDWRLPVPQDSL